MDGDTLWLQRAMLKATGGKRNDVFDTGEACMPCLTRTFSSRALLKVSQDVLEEVTGVFGLFAGCQRKTIVKIEILSVRSRIEKRLDFESPIALNG